MKFEIQAFISIEAGVKQAAPSSSLSGRFSRVHLAKHRGTESHHALKVLKGEVSQEEFQRELCIGCRLRHRNLALYIVGYKGKERAIAME